MERVKNRIILTLIIFLAIILRFWQLGNIPIGFNDDEAAFGYNAYSILKTGRDEWGRLLPFPVFESFGDWKLSGYLYLTVLTQSALGPTEFATRLPSAAFGVFAVFATYLLTSKLFNKTIALLSAFLLAISPWHIIASRNAFESDILIFTITISTYFFLRSLGEKKYFKLSLIGCIFSFYVYRSAWIFIPLFFATLVKIYYKDFVKHKNYFVKQTVVASIFLLPLIPAIFTFKGQSRFFQESFIAGIQRIGITNDINNHRNSCQEKFPKTVCILIFNKYTFFTQAYLNNYFANLSYETYYLKSNPTGYQAPAGRSLLYTFEIPFLVVGLASLIKKRNRAIILLSWILIVPIGAAITSVGNPGRLNILMPALQMVTAYGGYTIWQFFKPFNIKMIYLTICVTIISFSVAKLWVDMFTYQPKISSRYQRYGYKPLFNYLESQKNRYNLIAVSRKSDDAKQYIHYLFYEKVDPSEYQNASFATKYRGADNWAIVERIGNIYFFPSAPTIQNMPANSLLAIGEQETSFPVKPIYAIDYLNGDKAFGVYSVDELKSYVNTNPNTHE